MNKKNNNTLTSLKESTFDQEEDFWVGIGCLTYNHEAYIREAIEGFLMQQTNFPVRIVIFDDCSTDATASILKEYEEKYPHLFKLFLQPKNIFSNPEFAQEAIFPFLLELVNGRYIALCEGDDYWLDPLKLQKQVDFLEKNQDYSNCLHNRYIEDIKGNQKLEIRKKYYHVFTQCLLFRTKSLNPELLSYLPKVFNKDSFLMYSLLLAGKSKTLDFAGAVYRYHGEGIYSSMDYSSKIKHKINTLEQFIKLEDEYSKNAWHKELFYDLKTELIDNYLWQIYTDKNNSDFVKAYLRAIYKHGRIFKKVNLKRLYSLYIVPIYRKTD